MLKVLEPQNRFSTGSDSRERAPCYFYIQRGGLPQPALLIVFSIRLKATDLLDSYRRFTGYCFEKPVIILLHFVSTWLDTQDLSLLHLLLPWFYIGCSSCVVDLTIPWPHSYHVYNSIILKDIGLSQFLVVTKSSGLSPTQNSKRAGLWLVTLIGP